MSSLREFTLILVLLAKRCVRSLNGLNDYFNAPVVPGRMIRRTLIRFVCPFAFFLFCLVIPYPHSYTLLHLWALGLASVALSPPPVWLPLLTVPSVCLNALEI